MEREKILIIILMHTTFSDGTLRFICLTSLLLQPKPAPIIIIDEPELGLHPFAIAKLAALIKKAAVHSQIIISTQSIAFCLTILLEDIIVVEREDNQSIFKHLKGNELSSWLEDYSIGELWDKNVIGGRP
ncbi:MAG: AAA family ATPase [Saprospiraceae bacterium]